MNKVSFMITCFDEVLAIDIALTSLRKFYPDSGVLIFCEGNAQDFKFLEKKHNVIVSQGADTQSKLLKLTESSYCEKDYPYVEDAMRIFLERIRMTISVFSSDYIVLHCPDTLIRGKFDIPNNTGLLGSCVNKYFPESINKILIEHGGIKVNCFGAVPAIFNVKDFELAYQKITSRSNLLKELAKAFYASFSHDILMSILFSLIGKQESFNPQIVECTRNLNWINTSYPIVHQFRTFYPERKTKYKSQEND